MSTLLAGPVQSVSLPEQETALARQSSKALDHFVTSGTRALTLRLEDQDTGQKIEVSIPVVAVRALSALLSQMAQGHPVTLVPLHAELSTQQAAELLGVSRPYFIKLLEEGQIPFRKVGEQRRVRYQDVLAYIETYKQEATAALDEMVAEAQRLSLYE